MNLLSIISLLHIRNNLFGRKAEHRIARPRMIALTIVDYSIKYREIELFGLLREILQIQHFVFVEYIPVALFCFVV